MYEKTLSQFKYMARMSLAAVLYFVKGRPNNDLTVLGGRGCLGFCDNSIEALVLKSVKMD